MNNLQNGDGLWKLMIVVMDMESKLGMQGSKDMGKRY